jgi:hypothetical protein
MRLRVERKWLTAAATIGLLTVDGVNECFTLEDKVRAEKVYGETAIPAGTYNVVITHSKRFKRDLPLLEDVPNFEGVRIHPGNTAADTDGCLLVGTSKGPDVIFESRKAFDALYNKIKSALDAGEKVTLEIA